MEDVAGDRRGRRDVEAVDGKSVMERPYTERHALRFPRLVGFRQDDKKSEDVTTVAEIVKLYNQQAVTPTTP